MSVFLFLCPTTGKKKHAIELLHISICYKKLQCIFVRF